MTRLRKIMLEELQRRNYSAATIRSYICTVQDFAQHFNCQPDRLSPRHIREYQAELFQKRKLSPGSVAVRLAALRFFYTKTLQKAWSVSETPYPKKNHRLPAVLSQEEVTRLIDAADTPFHRTVLMTLYATGLRCAELTHLKVSDVDSKRMVIHVRGGKGRGTAMSCSALSCSTNFADTGVGCGEKPAIGSFPVIAGIPGITRWIRKRLATPAGKPLSAPAFRNACIRTCCGTALLHTFSRLALICAKFRSC